MANQSPLRETLHAAGATFGELGSEETALDFGDPTAEYRAARHGVAVIDRSASGRIEVTGPDAAAFLHNLTTNDVKALAPGRGCEAFLPSAQAKVLGHAMIFRLDDRSGPAFWLDLAPGQSEKVLRHLDRHLISEHVALTDRTAELAQINVCGPNAVQCLELALGTRPDQAPTLSVSTAEGVGQRFQIRRTDALVLPGFDLVGDSGAIAALWKCVVAAGARPAGARVAEILRVEAGRPLYGVDIDETNLPQEVGRTEQAISFTKGCYIGQETVARIRTYGHVNRSLVGLRPGGDTAPERGAPVFRDGAEVGRVTSSVISPTLGIAVALAYVKRGSEQPGTMLQIQNAGATYSAEVVKLPFVS